MEKDIARAFQQRLKDLGWYSGSIDGVLGTQSEAAVTAFKKATGLKATSFVGPVTLSALFDDGATRNTKPPTSPTPLSVGANLPWMAAAKNLEGLKEVPGPASNPTIMKWAKELGLSATYTDDGVSWCGLFVGYVMRNGAPDALPAKPLGAREWLKYGVETTPGYGAILVFWRGSKSGWQGHVGFYVGEDGGHYYVLGGNQSDSVNVAKIAKERFLGARKPKSAPALKPVQMTAAGKVSTNEA